MRSFIKSTTQKPPVVHKKPRRPHKRGTWNRISTTTSNRATGILPSRVCHNAWLAMTTPVAKTRSPAPTKITQPKSKNGTGPTAKSLPANKAQHGFQSRARNTIDNMKWNASKSCNRKRSPLPQVNGRKANALADAPPTKKSQV